MGVIPRKILSICPATSDKSLRRAICSVGWTLNIFRSVTDVRQHVRSGKYHVGIVVFQDVGESNYLEVEDLVSESYPMVWIALTPPRLLEDLNLRRLVRGSFRDYHTLPVDPERLS